MCWVCATSKMSLSGKYYDAFPADGVGDLKPINVSTVLLLTPDTVADDISTTDSVTVDGPAIVSTIDVIGDQDFFRVELTAGHIYDIGQYLIAGASTVMVAVVLVSSAMLSAVRTSAVLTVRGLESPTPS